MDGAIIGALGAAAGAFSPLPDLACSTSLAITRPCGPEPLMRPSSMPASFAKRRASGEEKMRAWPLAWGADAAGWGAATGAAVAAAFAAGAGAVAAFAAGASADEAAFGGALAAP